MRPCIIKNATKCAWTSTGPKNVVLLIKTILDWSGAEPRPGSVQTLRTNCSSTWFLHHNV